jgi:hypothetical protein
MSIDNTVVVVVMLLVDWSSCQWQHDTVVSVMMLCQYATAILKGHDFTVQLVPVSVVVTLFTAVRTR